jgi:dTMP kinase
MFIVLEGIDGCGKSTLAKALQARLQQQFRSHDTVLFAEPTRHLAAGKLLRQHLEHTPRLQLQDPHFIEYLALLMAADRQQHYWQEIYPAIQAQHWVLCDRFTWSSLAYQGAGGLSIDWLIELNSRVPVPDLTILVELDVETSRQRREGTRTTEELFESDQMLRRVAAGYHWLASQATGHGLIDDALLLRLDGRGSTEIQLETLLARLSLFEG